MSSIISLLPLEILYHIADQIPDPATFIAWNSVCKLFNEIIQNPKTQERAKSRLAKETTQTSAQGNKEVFYALPNKLKHGEFKCYYPNTSGDKADKLFFECSYIEDVRQGEYRQFSEEGNLVQTYIYKDDKYHGVAKRYFPNKIVEQEMTFVTGELDGLAKYYYDNGATEEIRTYKQGKLNGETKSWTKEGILNEHTLYEENDIKTQFMVCGKPMINQ